jgi:hypothetical protein
MAPNEGEKELRRSAPAAASKLRVPTQQKGGEALQKPATTEEDASTRNGQREKRREERERERGRRGARRGERGVGSRVSDSPFLPVCPSLREPARYAWFSRGRVLGRADGQQGMYALGREPFTGRE